MLRQDFVRRDEQHKELVKSMDGVKSQVKSSSCRALIKFYGLITVFNIRKVQNFHGNLTFIVFR